MSAIPFLMNRQIGSKPRSEFRTSYSNLNLDNVISRLVCYTKDIFTIQGEETEVPPFACKFRRDAQSDLLAVCNEDGAVSLYDTSRKHQDSLLKTFSAHKNAIFDLCWLPDKCQLICGAGDHSASLWDITHCKCLSVYKNHTASLKSVDVCCEQSAIFVTGSRDGNINVWDTRENAVSGVVKPVITIPQAHSRRNQVYFRRKLVQKNSISSVSGVAFQNINHLASVGVADGALKIWDLRRTYVAKNMSNSRYWPSPRYHINYANDPTTGHGCTSLVFDSGYKTLYACSTNNKILKFDCHSYTKEAVVYEGFRCVTYFVKLDLSSDDQYLLCGSSDEKAYIWKTSKPGLPIVELAAHSAEVTSVSWSPYDITKLVTCGDDFKVAIWKVADTETVSLNMENIHSIAEPYRESPKNGSPPLVDSILSSVTGSNRAIRTSPVESTRTPSKPAIRVITNFFSPITPSPIQTSDNHIQNDVAADSNDSPRPTNKLPNKNSIAESSSQVLMPCNHVNSIAESSSQVLTPCNHVNKNNIMHQSPSESSETKSSPEHKNSSPEYKNNGTIFLNPSTSVQNKENESTDLSPETACTTNNTDQTKRKLVSKLSTPIVKRKRTESSKKSKGLVKVDKKAVTGKTIMNYFSVALSSDD